LHLPATKPAWMGKKALFLGHAWVNLPKPVEGPGFPEKI